MININNGVYSSGLPLFRRKVEWISVWLHWGIAQTGTVHWLTRYLETGVFYADSLFIKQMFLKSLSCLKSEPWPQCLEKDRVRERRWCIIRIFLQELTKSGSRAFSLGRAEGIGLCYLSWERKVAHLEILKYRSFPYRFNERIWGIHGKKENMVEENPKASPKISNVCDSAICLKTKCCVFLELTSF